MVLESQRNIFVNIVTFMGKETGFYVLTPALPDTPNVSPSLFRVCLFVLSLFLSRSLSLVWGFVVGGGGGVFL